MNVDCVIIDADNTLYSTKRASALGYKALFSYLALKTGITEESLRDTFTLYVSKVKDDPNPRVRKKEYALQMTLQKFFKDSPQLIPEALEHFWEVVVKNLEPAPRVQEVISTLTHKYTLVLASDEFQKSLIPKLQYVLKSLDAFSMIVTPEVTAVMKPSPLYYTCVIEDLAFKPERCVVVGDRWIHDLEPAKELGMQTILVNAEEAGTPTMWVERLDEILLFL